MGKVIWDFANGPVTNIIKNIGDEGGVEMDLIRFLDTTNAISYDSTAKSVRMYGDATKPGLRTANITNIMNKDWGMRLIFKFHGGNTIWGTEISPYAKPFRVQYNKAYGRLYIDETLSIVVPEYFINYANGLVNDLTFWYSYTTGKFTVKNNVTGDVLSFGIPYSAAQLASATTISGASGIYHIYLGCANFNGFPNLAGDIEVFAGSFAWDSQEYLLDVKFLLKKDDNYYTILDGVPVSRGSDLATAKEFAISIGSSIYKFLGEYKLIQFSTESDFKAVSDKKISVTVTDLQPRKISAKVVDTKNVTFDITEDTMKLLKGVK